MEAVEQEKPKRPREILECVPSGIFFQKSRTAYP